MLLIILFIFYFTVLSSGLTYQQNKETTEEELAPTIKTESSGKNTQDETINNHIKSLKDQEDPQTIYMMINQFANYYFVGGLAFSIISAYLIAICFDSGDNDSLFRFVFILSFSILILLIVNLYFLVELVVKTFCSKEG